MGVWSVPDGMEGTVSGSWTAGSKIKGLSEVIWVVPKIRVPILIWYPLI